MASTALMAKWIVAEPDFMMEGSSIYCKLCLKPFKIGRKQELNQHKSTRGHINARNNRKNQGQQPITKCSTSANDSTPDVVIQELVSACLEEGIPLSKLERGPLKSFLEKHLPKLIPSRKILSNRVTNELFEQVQVKTRAHIGNSPIWCSVDESTDRLGRNIVNVLVGKLDTKNSAKGRLIMLFLLKEQTHLQSCSASRKV
ncbi:hypothetical protein GE061_000193 [Apolygus lucorum]|uniref:BED-type domain-containing protein n=1 Tax=Apolygus lucorum TaxID=248454 RepID=A0A8S9Y5M5_APOLU|nr:hypothetical protein GE061_000193 [Apolygus lucorum]